MNDFSILPETMRHRLRSVSMGVKLVVICFLALLMTIPGFFVESLVHDRTQRASDVVKEISTHVGGQQSFLGPTLAIPYTISDPLPPSSSKHGMYIVFPSQASA